MSLRDFVIMEKLGQGSFAQVYKARRLTDQKLYALKQVMHQLW
jgi:serine/threonine protein kinase